MLTVEELKLLEVGDWVWIVDFEKIAYKPAYDGSMYARKTPSYQEDKFMCGTLGRGFDFDYSTYGSKWVAYKNKEEAEGRSITLPYLLCTSNKFACVIWQKDGKVHKTYTMPIDEAKSTLKKIAKLF